MQLGSKTPNSLTTQPVQPLVLNDGDDVEVFDFSTLRDELALDHSDEEVDEQEHDTIYEIEENGDSLGFEFAADTDNFTSTTFEEEAFRVKKSGPRTKEGIFKQSQPNLWTKDPFAGPSYGTTPSKTGQTGNEIKKITRRANINPPPISREISAGISFASITSGKAPQAHDDNDTQKKAHAPMTDTDTPSVSTVAPTNNGSPNASQSPPSMSPNIKPPSPSTLILQEIKASTDETKHPPITDLTQPTVYNVADIEANMNQQQQQQTPNKNLLYQLLPGLSQQKQQQPSNGSPQHQPSKQGPVDINSFFQKHHERQQQQQSPFTPAITTDVTQQQPVDINSFFQKHQQQKAKSANHSNTTNHQPSSATAIHKPNMTTEQELKQKEDDGKDSYDGLMTAKNVKYIDQIERSKLADSNQHSTGDFYYHMYTANHSAKQNPAPMINQASNINNRMIYQQEQAGDSGKDHQAALDKVLGDIIEEHGRHKETRDDKKRSTNDHHQILKTIESIYFLVLQVEQSYREMNGSMPPMHNPAPPTSSARQETMSKIWNTLAMDQSPRTVVSILKVNKGMSLIGRLVPYLDDSQRQILMTTIAYYFVDILSSPSMNSTDAQGSHHQQRQNIDYIHPSISGCLEHILYGASLSYITQILSSVANHSDFNLLVGTTTGHRFLGTLLFHANGKQRYLQQEDSDKEHWAVTFGSYFDKAMESSSIIKNMAHLDNLAVWMLLNSMTACCNPQQIDRLVQAYRETVSMTMKTISDLERNLVPVPYPIQASYPVVKDLWSNLCLDESLKQDGCP